MCLMLRRDSKEKVLKEDLIVYKVLRKSSAKLVSNHDHYYIYKLGELNEGHIVREQYQNNFDQVFADSVAYRKYCDAIRYERFDCYRIGFHSIESIDRVMEGGHYDEDDAEIQALVKCTIPKGSTIARDETGLIVSNKIIIKEIIL